MGDNNTLISMVNAMPEYSYMLSSETSNWDFALVYKTANSDCATCGSRSDKQFYINQYIAVNELYCKCF